nr:MAG TPA: hypothetical protein [Caudoviricetes sp.]
MTGTSFPRLRAGLHLEALHRFRQDQLAVHALGGHEAHLVGAGVQLVQAAEGAVLAVGNPVVAVVTEGHGLVARSQTGHEGRCAQRTVQQRVRLADVQTRLPDIVSVVVLEGHELENHRLIAEELGLLAVRSAEAVVQLEDLVEGDLVHRSGSHAHLRTGIVQQTQGLAHAVTRDECPLLRVAHAHAETLRDIGGEVEGGVVQQLVGDLDHGAQLVSGQHGLAEGGVALGDLLALIDPAGFAVVLRDGNLAGAGAGADDGGQTTEEVIVLQRLHQLLLELVRHGIAALGVLTDGQGIVDLAVAAPGADHVPERIAVLSGRGGTCILVLGCAGLGVAVDRGGSGSRQLGVDLRLLLQTLDLRAQVLDLLRHLVVLLHSVGGHKAVLAAVLLQERLGLLPEGVALIAQFQNLAHRVNPPVEKLLITGYKFVDNPVKTVDNKTAGRCSVHQLQLFHENIERHRAVLGFSVHVDDRGGRGFRCFGCRSRCVHGRLELRHTQTVQDVQTHLAGRIERGFQMDALVILRLFLLIRLFFLLRVFLRFIRLHGFKEDFIGKTQLHRFLGVHPGLIFHELGDAVVGQAALGGIGVDDALLDLVQRGDSLLHVLSVAHCNGAGVMDHEHSHRGHQHLVAGHRDHAGCGCGNGIDLHGHRTGVVPEHGVNLCRSEHIATRRVDPDRDVAGIRIQFFPERFRGHLVAPEGLIVDGAFQPKHPAAGFVVNPVPEFLHLARFLPFCVFFGVLSLCRFSLSGSCCVSSSSGSSSFGWFCSTAVCLASANLPASFSFT